MEILREAKPVQINKIDKKDKFTIPGTAKQKSPLAIEYLDYLTIAVDQNWRAQNKMKKCEVSQRDGLEIPAMERIPTQVEYVDELLIKGEENPENEIQLIDQMEILKQEKPEKKAFIKATRKRFYLYYTTRKITFTNRIHRRNKNKIRTST